jgi:hypothetical protein
LAKLSPTSSAPISPGAAVAATASISTPAAASALSVKRDMDSRWLRAAISGTTPPYRE